MIDAAMIQAVQIAEKIAPYRHARLSAVKLAGDPNNPVRFRDSGTLEELRAEVLKHLEILAPVLGLEALMPPPDGIANTDMPRGGAGNGTGAYRLRYLAQFPSTYDTDWHSLTLRQ